MELKSNFSQDFFAYIKDEMAAKKVPGAAIAAVKNGSVAGVWHFGQATADLAVAADTVFEAASITKTMFACLCMRLASEGRLDLDEPFAAKIPHINISQDERIYEITPRIVLSHGAGLPNWGVKPLGFSFAPGQGFNYSGEGFFFLQQYIEAQTCKTLPQLFDEYFFTPLGMKNSAALWQPRLNMAHGFDKSGKVNKIRDSVDTGGLAPEPNSAWSLYTTAEDFSAYMAYVINHKAGISDDLFFEMTKAHNRATESVLWGLGWGMLKDDPNVIWHWGDNRGFKSLTYIDTKALDGLCIFTNSDNGAPFTLSVANNLTQTRLFDHIGDFILHAE